MTIRQTNLILCIVAVLIILIAIYRMYRKGKKQQQRRESEQSNYDYQTIYRRLTEIFNEIIYSRPEDMSVTYEEAKKRRESKDSLSYAKRMAAVNDLSSRLYLMSFINKTLQTELGINEVTIDRVFPFRQKDKLEHHIQFLVLMYTVMQTHGSNAWTWMQEEHDLGRLRENGRYEIYQSDIDMLYNLYVAEIPYTVKLDVLTQRIYEQMFGQGNVDLLSWQNIEDLAVGQGGIPPTNSTGHYKKLGAQDQSIAGYDKVVILYKGISIHLRFMGMGTQRELERICRHICLYKNPGELSEDVGYMENSLANGDRVVVYRDSFGDSWGFLIRKHKDGHLMTLQEMYPADEQHNAEAVYTLLHGLMIGCRSTIVSGRMYSGKSTLLCAMVNEANANYNYRVMESIFELNMRSLFPTRNIATFLERKNMSGDEVLEFLKRTNGDVFILAEMLKEVSANWLISAGQNGFKFVLSTAHFVTTEAMIKWLLNSKLNTSGAGDSTLTMLDIVNAIHFDVHCDFDETIGMRYIERITEIVPTGDERIYELVDVLKFDKKTHTYHIVNTLSPYTLQCIEEYSTEAEFQRFMLLFHDLGGETKI